MDDSQAATSAVAALSKACQCQVPEPKSVYITRWGKDPFARGSWTYYVAHSRPSDCSAFRQPVGANGCVAFAGEHTCDGSLRGLDIGTVHGAWLSGELAARTLIARASAKGSDGSTADMDVEMPSAD